MRVCHDVFARQNPRYVDRTVACCLALLAGTVCFLFSLLLSSFVPTNNCKLVERNDLYGRGRRRMCIVVLGCATGPRRPETLSRSRARAWAPPSITLHSPIGPLCGNAILVASNNGPEAAGLIVCFGMSPCKNRIHSFFVIVIANYWICVFYLFCQ